MNQTAEIETLRTIDQLSPKEYIIIKGANVHNLKSLDVAIPRNKLVVISGLSGSGKSSLAFDTLFAEGQRMYVESLSSYARQFLGRMEKPDVEYIKGVSPAIAIEQKVSTRNPRSTVGTSTEIYDYLKLLFARVGVTYSPVSGGIVKKDTVTDVVNYIFGSRANQRVMILAPLLIQEGRTLAVELKILLQKGYTRILAGGEVREIEEELEREKGEEGDKREKREEKGKGAGSFPSSPLSPSSPFSLSSLFEILIDRGTVQFDYAGQPDEDTQYRFSDSVQTAFSEGNGTCRVVLVRGADVPNEDRVFSDKFELDGITFEEPGVNLFTFNNPYGACRRCDGFGKVLGIDPDLVIPDKNLSVFEGAIMPWRSEKMGDEFLKPLLRNGIRFDFPIHRPYKELTPAEQSVLWTGNDYFTGLNGFFEWVESQSFKVQYRVMQSRYRGKTVCPDCRGSRLRKDAGYVKVGGVSITDLVLMPISTAVRFFDALDLPADKRKIADRILIEIRNRLAYMERVGLGYLSLNRLTNSLSGGEYQRIKLATSLGSALVGSMYILDEPSIGLHPRDTKRLVSVLESLRDMGNTVIVVEHEEDVMRAADQLIDIGPEAGLGGGKLVFQGKINDELDQVGVPVMSDEYSREEYSSLITGTPARSNSSLKSHTLDFLTGRETIPVPTFRRKPTHWIGVTGAHENNLKNVDVQFPLNTLTVITGVSGSGKSTLVRKILYPALARLKGNPGEEAGKFSELVGSVGRVAAVEMIDQNPIGKSSRSNPVTYIKAYDYLRQALSEQPLSKSRAYKPSQFSFNVDGGRCEICQGEGEVKVEMQFMADIYLKCEGCGGRRFKQETLEVTLGGKNVSDILALTVDEAIDFFAIADRKMAEKLLPLQEVGLGYVGLGQSANTLSGGEAQRVKLASYLGKGNPNKGQTLFIFDEPTTGLHFHDIRVLLKAINALVDQGDSVIIIEHNVEVIKCADYIIDLGREGGDEGGYVTFTGTPEAMIELPDGVSYTAEFLREKL